MKENEVVRCDTLMNTLYHINCVVIEINYVKISLKRKEPNINQTRF